MKFLVLSSLFVALGACSFSAAITILSETPRTLTFPFLAFLYIFAMHIFNQFLDKGASAYNEPERSAFLRKYRYLLITSGMASLLTALILAFDIGFITFAALAGFSLMGIFYSIPLMPKKMQVRFPYAKFKDIPGSKTLAQSMAWVAVIGILPLLESKQISPAPATISNLFLFTISYAVFAFFDLFRVQGVLIVGTETLPIVLGKKKTIHILRALLITAGIVLVAGPVFGLSGQFSLVMLTPVATLGLCLVAYEKSWVYPGITLEALVEGNFFLAGLLAAIWHFIV
jgi:4-hydroxy-3-methylbut-2-enyl diphosphate reductase